jgi:hypothetical protein
MPRSTPDLPRHAPPDPLGALIMLAFILFIAWAVANAYGLHFP